jgi:hypothetical protein
MCRAECAAPIDAAHQLTRSLDRPLCGGIRSAGCEKILTIEKFAEEMPC